MKILLELFDQNFLAKLKVSFPLWAKSLNCARLSITKMMNDNVKCNFSCNSQLHLFLCNSQTLLLSCLTWDFIFYLYSIHSISFSSPLDFKFWKWLILRPLHWSNRYRPGNPIQFFILFKIAYLQYIRTKQKLLLNKINIIEKAIHSKNWYKKFNKLSIKIKG